MNFTQNIVQKLPEFPIFWKILALYLLITGVICVWFEPQIILWNRGIFMGFVCIYLILQKLFSKQKHIISLIIAYAFLGVIYKETAIIHPLFFKPIDPFLMQVDEFLFGYQPALEFSQKFPQKWFSELMFFGYFSYYLTPLAVIFALRNQPQQKINQFGLILIGSFVIYYLIFILIPAIGPQFYWNSENNYVVSQGLLGDIIKIIQTHGEAPTAAFPSSHVGISVIILLWLYAHHKKLMWYILPFAIVLIFSTVYIKAHYAIDVIAGFLSGIIIYLITNDYNKRSKNR